MKHFGQILWSKRAYYKFVSIGFYGFIVLLNTKLGSHLSDNV
jgi:hypothetical protein